MLGFESLAISVITNGTLLVNDCAPVLVAVKGAPFHSKIPYSQPAVSNQYAPPFGAPAGAVATGASAAKSISARATYARLLTPR